MAPLTFARVDCLAAVCQHLDGNTSENTLDHRFMLSSLPSPVHSTLRLHKMTAGSLSTAVNQLILEQQVNNCQYDLSHNLLLSPLLRVPPMTGCDTLVVAG